MRIRSTCMSIMCTPSIASSMHCFKHKVDIQGNCSTEPSAGDLSLPEEDSLDDWRPGQCMLITDVGFMYLTYNIWLDSLYIRHHRTRRSASTVVLACMSKGCNLWMTDVTLQGDGSEDPIYGGLVAAMGGQLYANGMICNRLEYCILHFTKASCLQFRHERPNDVHVNATFYRDLRRA